MQSDRWSAGAAALTSVLVLAAASSQSPSERRVDAALRELGTGNNERALLKLARLGDAAVTALVELLREEPDDERAWQAVRALRQIGRRSVSGEPALMLVLRDRELPEERRALAALAIGGMEVAGAHAIVPLVRTLSDLPPSEIQLCATLALAEIGPNAGFRLGKELMSQDGLTVVLAASALTLLGPEARKATVELRACAESLGLGDQRFQYVVQPLAELVLDQLGADYVPAGDAGAVVAREIGPEIDLILCRGGRLDPAMMTDPASCIPMLVANFRRLRDQTEPVISVPAHFEDWNGDGLFTTGELTRGLAFHFASELDALVRVLEADGYPTYASWREATAGTLGLMQVLFELTRPVFLDKSLCLELASRPFYGLFPAPSPTHD
jgi:hypothetical protein